MKIGVLPGSFNPPTLGHLDIIQRASKICNRLLVAVIRNPGKPESLFTYNEKHAMLEAICAPFSNVKIVGFEGLLVDFVVEHKADFVIRGLRSEKDFEFEEQMAVANNIMEGIETVFLLTSPEYAHISSTLIREIGSYGRRLHDFVPSLIEQSIFDKISKVK